jgi:hypothetical protein
MYRVIHDLCTLLQIITYVFVIIKSSYKHASDFGRLRGRLRELKNTHKSVTVRNRTHVYTYFFFLIIKTYEIISRSNVHKS